MAKWGNVEAYGERAAVTSECVEAFNAGVRAVLHIAEASATKIKAMPWKPGREGAVDALEELGKAGHMLLCEPEKAVNPGCDRL